MWLLDYPLIQKVLPIVKVGVEIEELAKSLNLPLETHTVTTQDGYIIEVSILILSKPKD